MIMNGGKNQMGDLRPPQRAGWAMGNERTRLRLAPEASPRGFACG